jgi:RNA polymerase sigma factor (sigma-70 family)
LIFSIPLKHGLSRDDASEIFQSVCVDLLTELSNLRQPKAIAGWLIQITAHKALRYRRQQQRMVDLPAETAESGDPGPESLLRDLEREQALRDAIVQLKPRCQKLMHALFFEDPPRAYQDIAAALGLAIGSIGFVRGRCLEKLRAALEEAGF